MTIKPQFQTYAYNILSAEKSAGEALKDHSQIALIIDTLSRKENHHVLLTGSQSNKIQLGLLKSIALHITDGNAPKTLRDVDFIYFDAKRLALNPEDLNNIAADFNTFHEELKTLNKRVVFAINHFDATNVFGQLIQSILTDDHWRLVILDAQSQRIPYELTTIKLAAPSESQLLNLLKTYKPELETFHHVLIPEESFASALSMASHYLPTHSSFDKALELLDSAAARASAMERSDSTGQFRPVVTNTTLSFIISTWTQIPITHLHNNAFQSNKFSEALQRCIFGQDAALTTMGSVLQHACIKLQEKTGPLCSFLLVGPAEIGKATVAYGLAEHLFGHKGALLRVNLDENYTSIAEVKIIAHGESSTSLLTAIEQIPYAVILIENIHQMPVSVFNLFRTIVSQGYALDQTGKKYDFSHSIIIATTSLGSDRIVTLSQMPEVHETNRTLDLMQLVLNEQPQETAHVGHNLSVQELCEELIPSLEGYFGSALLQHLQIIPFLPLDYAAFEKVVRLKIKALVRRLEANFGIELTYAPEIIKFLAHEALWRKPQTKPLKKVLEQYLYAPIANEIIAHAEDKNRPRRLLLQLNDHGESLRCEFISAMGATIYNL